MISHPDFPRLTPDNHRVSSPASADYNCIAWSVGDTEHWWQPGLYWPILSPADDYGIGVLEAFAVNWFVLLWVSVEALHVAFGIRACRRMRAPRERGVIPLVVSIAASVVPFATLLLVLFAFAGSSLVAEIAEADARGWQLWKSAWLFLIFANPVMLVVALIGAVCPPYSEVNLPSFACRFLAVVTAGFASCFGLLLIRGI